MRWSAADRAGPRLALRCGWGGPPGARRRQGTPGRALSRGGGAGRAGRMPIILCTGFSHSIDAAKAAVQGINAFLMKPLMAHELGLAIQQVLAQRTVRGDIPA